jgi:LysM repeat protein
LSLRLNLRLKSIGGSTLAVTLLAAVMLALFPVAAEAQTSAQTEDKSTPAIVVRPGDSLWSISEQFLGPDATPQRIADATERIHALNRGRIGADPDLIFVGQELSLPPTLSERSTGAPATRKSAHAAEVAPRDRAAEGTTGTTGKAPKPVPRTGPAGGADAKGGEATETAARQKAEPVGLPALQDEAAAAPVPAVRAVASDGSPTSPVASLLRKVRAELASIPTALAESFADAGTEGRRLLGLGVLALTFLVTALLAWKLPMRRTTRRDTERWGILNGHYRHYHGTPPEAYRNDAPFASIPAGIGDAPAANGARDASATASAAAAPRVCGPKAKARVKARVKARAKASPRNGLALGAHNPEVRRAPLRAHATMRARRLRPRLGHGRGVSARGGR